MNKQISTEIGMVTILIVAAVGGIIIWAVMKASQMPEKINIPSSATNTANNGQQIPSQKTKEQGCTNSGGTIASSFCCNSVSDFPNSCLIGACGCAPANSHQVKTCDCGEGKCFDGNSCVDAKLPAAETTNQPNIAGTIYKNAQYGFQLTLPKGWEKYSTEDISKPSDIVADLAFNLPTADAQWIKSGSKTGTVFFINIIPISKFPSLEASCEKEFGRDSTMCYQAANKVGQNDKYFFYYIRADKSTDFPKDFAADLFNQVDGIVKTFKAVN